MESSAGATLERFDQLLPSLSAVPLPGSGATLARWRLLAETGRTDLSLARLVEGHLDALAILVELDRTDLISDRGTMRLAVWAAEPGRLVATRSADGWLLAGTKRWCSGSMTIDGALITATAEDGPRLFFVDLPRRGVSAEPGSWEPLGMVATRSETLLFEDVHVRPAEAIGQPGDYVERPGFGHGGAGVAACWLGGTAAVLESLAKGANEDDDQALAALGSGSSELEAAWSVVQEVAAEVDDHPCDITRSIRLAARTRLVAEGVATRTLRASVEALGSRGLCHDRVHSRAVADLLVYVSQLRRRAAEIDYGRGVLHSEGVVPW